MAAPNQKICLNCLNPVLPKRNESVTSDGFRQRIYCCHGCSIKMRRRIRNRQAHPPAVQAELDARVSAGRMDVPAPRADTMCFNH